jgi:Zn-dependent peptidase ImmA (M78 family)
VPATSRAAELARGLLREQEIESPPVPVAGIARSLGVPVVSKPLEGDLSGFLLRKGGRAVIGVNSSHPVVRQRFTIAHEIGHFLLSKEEGVHLDRGFDLRLRDPRSAPRNRPSEAKANLFAAELLMPAEMVTDDLGAPGTLDFFNDGFLRGLAKRYEVSTQALMIRLGVLGYH